MLSELLLGTVIVVVMTVAVLTMSLQSTRLRSLDEEHALAFAACRNGVERIRSLPFGQVLAQSGTGFTVPGRNGEPNGLRPRPGDTDGMPGEVLVTVAESNGPVQMLLVQVRVLWEGRNGPQQCQLNTLVADREGP